jgi:predicted XRE-type DNA-binding protein
MPPLAQILFFNTKGWSQREAAQNLSIVQPSIAEVMKTKIEKFTN